MWNKEEEKREREHGSVSFMSSLSVFVPVGAASLSSGSSVKETE